MLILVILPYMNGLMDAAGMREMEEVSREIMVKSPIKSITVFTTICFLLVGCVKHVDKLVPFHFTGAVVNEVSKTPIEDADVIFIDRGFNNYLPADEREKATFIIGKTDANGYFDIKFNFWWGLKEAFYISKPEEIFDLLFIKPEYKDKVISYDLENLPRENNVIQVNVGKITLTPMK
jgi:hypothetical protein